MNGKQYNNVIDWTLTHDEAAQSADSLTIARAVFKNMGVALPQGNLQQIHETLKTDDFMGWRSCTMQEAQEAADNGVAAIGIGDDRLVVLSAADTEEPVADTASVMTLSENTSAYAVAGFQYYAYSYGSSSSTTTTTTVPRPTPNPEPDPEPEPEPEYGCGGTYREVVNSYVNCFEYAMLFDEDMDASITISPLFDPKLNSARFINKIMNTINRLKAKDGTTYTSRHIESYNSPIEQDEYRIAARVPNNDGYYYHFIYQLSDGTWAGKDGMSPSEHFGNGNPSVSPEMWSNDRYPASAGTIYFAVRRE